MPYMRNEGRRQRGWHSICKGEYTRWFHLKCAKLSKEEYQPAPSCVPISQTKKDARETTSAHHTTPTTDAALIQRLLQMETTLNGLSSEIQKIKEEMMDHDARHKNSEKLLHEKIKEQAEQIQQLETKLREQETQLQPPEVNHDQEKGVEKMKSCYHWNC